FFFLFSVLSLLPLRPPLLTLFPYTTLFRSSAFLSCLGFFRAERSSFRSLTFLDTSIALSYFSTLLYKCLSISSSSSTVNSSEISHFIFGIIFYSIHSSYIPLYYLFIL